MNTAADFRSTIRRGVRVGRPTLVLHVGSTGREGVQVGMVVSKTVGNAVTRNRVKRRLRHLAASHLPGTPPGTQLVVRALPASASAGPALASDLTSAWTTALRRLGERA